MSSNLNETLGPPHLSKDPETEGFDLQAGESWIYPTNYPVRQYQYNITQKALLENTLVSLPTGLGKTFIAAVVMFNYFRWYPLGKVVFMAPTRPLVKQQIDACYDIMGIPKDCTIEITGAKSSNSREEIWNEKRVFFITPQILQNDLDKFQNLGPKIKCLVFDEAHRARGHHAYCEVIRKLTTSNKFFRVLALSATPGGSIEDVLEVVQNLLISHLEFRTEDSLDVSPYVFQRNLTTVVVPLGNKLQEIKDTYMKVLEYYTRTLIKYKVVQGNCANLTKGKIFMLMKNYQQSNRGTSPNYAEIMKSLNICITLYHASELLIRHGLRSFLTFFEEHIDKPLLRNNTEIRHILVNVREYMGPPPQMHQLPDGEYPEVSENVKFGHPKFYKLRDILIDHFKETDSSSRVIVFFEYRESVMEAYALLIQSAPVLKPRVFIGQKQGVTQRLQISVVKAFREGRCNVLLSTCIGEEGLDVGEVDLIVCFDISNKSPIRMVQRMGRTGRKKDGKIVVLVTEGKEQQTLKDCLICKNNVAFHVLGSKVLANGLRGECPRLVPDGIVPKCEKIFITVEKPVIKKGSNLKDMLRTLSSKSSGPSFSPDLQIIEIEDKIPPTELFSTKEDPFDDNVPLTNIFSKRIEKQRSLQEIHQIQHSSNTELLVSLLQMAESRRFNIPMSQINTATQNRNLKQADIRNMFVKSQSASEFVLPPTQITQEPTPPTTTDDKNLGDPELFNELTSFLSIQMDNMKQCRLCPSHLNCGKIQCRSYASKTVPTWTELDASVYFDISLQDLKLFEKGLDICVNGSFQFDETMNFQIPDTPDNKIPTQKETKILELEDLIDISILADVCNVTTSFQAPKSLNKLLERYSTSLIDQEQLSQENMNTSHVNTDQKLLVTDNIERHGMENVEESAKIARKIETNLMPTAKGSLKVYSEEEIKDILGFFKLESLDSMFDVIPDSQNTVIYSPDIFDESSMVQENTLVKYEIDDESNSPILCSYINKMKPRRVQNLAFNSTPTSQSAKINVPAEKYLDTVNSISQESDKELCIKNVKSLDSTKETAPIELDDLFDFSFLEIPASKRDQTILLAEKIISLTDSCTKNDFCEDPLKTPKHSENGERCHDNSKTDLDVSDLENFFDEDLLKSPKLCGKTYRNALNQGNVATCLDFSEFKGPKTQRSDFSQFKEPKIQKNESNNMGTQRCDFAIPNSLDFTETRNQNVTKRKEPQKPLHSLENQSQKVSSKYFKKCDGTDIKSGREEHFVSEFKIQKNNSPQKIRNYFDVPKSLDFLDFIGTENTDTNNTTRKELESTQPSNILGTQLNKKPTSNIGPSQISVTQLISLVNKPTQPNKSSQKENLNQNIADFGDDDDLFNFSFNTKTPAKSKNPSSSSGKPSHTSKKTVKLKEMSNDDSKLNESEHNSSVDTTLGSKSSDSSTHSEKGPMVTSKITKNKISPKNYLKINEVGHNSFLNTSNSDDEFETKSKSPVWIRPKSPASVRLKSPASVGLKSPASVGLKSPASVGLKSPAWIRPKSPVAIRPKGLAGIRSKPLVRKRPRDQEDSDDEFETKVTSPVFARPKVSKKIRVERNGCNRGNASGPSNGEIKSRKLVNQFIEDEAELSICDKSDVSDDENELEMQDDYDKSFVADETQNVDSQMHAVYLKSINSPRLPNRFKIPTRFKNNMNIYSQEKEEDDESDLEDSFVVRDDAIESDHELSQLEILEKQLEMQRRRKKVSRGTEKSTKRKRIIVESDSD